MYAKRLSIIIKSNLKSNNHHDFTIASRELDGKNIAVTVIIDSDYDRLLRVSDFLKSKRLRDRKIKNGLMIKLLSKNRKYRIIEIEKYVTSNSLDIN